MIFQTKLEEKSLKIPMAIKIFHVDHG